MDTKLSDCIDNRVKSRWDDWGPDGIGFLFVLWLVLKSIVPLQFFPTQAVPKVGDRDMA